MKSINLSLGALALAAGLATTSFAQAPQGPKPPLSRAHLRMSGSTPRPGGVRWGDRAAMRVPGKDREREA